MDLNIFYVFKSIAVITLTDTPIVPLASGNILKVAQPHFEHFPSLTWNQPFLQGALIPFLVENDIENLGTGGNYSC